MFLFSFPHQRSVTEQLQFSTVRVHLRLFIAFELRKLLRHKFWQQLQWKYKSFHSEPSAILSNGMSIAECLLSSACMAFSRFDYSFRSYMMMPCVHYVT